MQTTIQNKNLQATINHHGAELVSLKNTQREFIWEGNPDFWGKHSPVLFPIVGTLKDNRYELKSEKYTLPRHGFARDMEFQLASKTENSVTFTLSSTETTKKIYPFEFELQIIYTLTEKGLEIRYKVFNNGDDQMLFSIGAHPAFALSNNFENYTIAMEVDEPLQYHLLENDLLSDTTEIIPTTDGKFQLNYSLFENDVLIFKTLQSKVLTIFESEKPMLKVAFPDFPQLGIWTKKDAPFICIEPWFGHSDTTESNGDFSTKEGIQTLRKNGVFDVAFSIHIL